MSGITTIPLYDLDHSLSHPLLPAEREPSRGTTPRALFRDLGQEKAQEIAVLQSVRVNRYRFAKPHPLKPRPCQHPEPMHSCSRRTHTVDAQS